MTVAKTIVGMDTNGFDLQYVDRPRSLTADLGPLPLALSVSLGDDVCATRTSLSSALGS